MSPSIPAADPNADPADKPAFYKNLVETIQAVIDPSLPLTSNLANLSAVIFYALVDAPYSRKINWAGFYLTEPSSSLDASKKTRMILGPFQGRVACTVIPFGKGVCGTAAEERRTVVVRDVHEFPGHIACDSASESEIVVPIVCGGRVVGVLDIDCLVKGGFDDEDRFFELVCLPSMPSNDDTKPEPLKPITNAQGFIVNKKDAASSPKAASPTTSPRRSSDGIPRAQQGGMGQSLLILLSIPMLWSAAAWMGVQ
ncbi:hypothetical protein HDU67_002247, partial [Dinochytrium kinnereticum]